MDAHRRWDVKPLCPWFLVAAARAADAHPRDVTRDPSQNSALSRFPRLPKRGGVLGPLSDSLRIQVAVLGGGFHVVRRLDVYILQISLFIACT